MLYKKIISAVLSLGMLMGMTCRMAYAENSLSYRFTWCEGNVLNISGKANMENEIITAAVYSESGENTGEMIYADQTVTDANAEFDFKTRIKGDQRIKISVGGEMNDFPLQYFMKKTEKTVYLSKNGNENGTGGMQDPVSTLQRAVELAEDNSKIQIVGKFELREEVQNNRNGIVICGDEMVFCRGSAIRGDITFRNITLGAESRAEFEGNTVFSDGVKFSEGFGCRGEYLFFEDNMPERAEAGAVIAAKKTKAEISADYIIYAGQGGKIYNADGKLYAEGKEQRAVSIDGGEYSAFPLEIGRGEHSVSFEYDFLLREVYSEKTKDDTYKIKVSGLANNLLENEKRQTPEVFVAVYDGKRLAGVKNKGVASDGGFDEEFVFEGISSDKFEIHVFLWDSFSRLVPLSTVYITDNEAKGGAEENVLYVSPDGNENAKGSFTDPLPLSEVQAAAREKATVDTVILRGGEYQIEKDMVFDSRDNGLTIKPYNGEEVTFSCDKKIPATLFKPISDEEVKESIISEEAREKILVCDVHDAGISNLGLIYAYELHNATGKNAPTLTIDGKIGTISRYPNKDSDGHDTFLTILEGTDECPFNPGSKTEKFSFYTNEESQQRMAKWSENYDHWACGYLAQTWADGIYKGEFLKNQNGGYYFSSSKPWKYAAPSVGGRVFFQNILEELDAPGEWYLERPSGLLYLYPYEDFGKDSEIRFSANAKKTITFSGASDIVLSGLTLNGIKTEFIDGSENISIEDCEIIGQGIDMSDCKNCTVSNNNFHDFAGGVIYVAGGNSTTLEYSGNVVENNTIKDYAREYKCYTPAVNIAGVGALVSGNEIYNAPHMAIGLGGQLNTVELNYIHDVCLETSDSGAIYGGGTFEAQGNVIRYNYFKNIMRTVNGYNNNAVYLDDLHSSASVFGNIFCNCETAALYGGGRANEFYNNVIVDCTNSIVVDARGTWGGTWDAVAGARVESLKTNIPCYNEGIWKEKFPHLCNVAEDEPEKPKYNKIYNNVYYNTNTENVAEAARESGVVKNNVSVSKEAFFDYENGIYSPKEGGEVYQKISGFLNIPVELIGRDK